MQERGEAGQGTVARALQALAALSPGTPVRQLAEPELVPQQAGQAPQEPDCASQGALAACAAASGSQARTAEVSDSGVPAPVSLDHPSPVLLAADPDPLPGACRASARLPVAPVLAAYLAPGGRRLYLVARRAPYTLGSLLRFSPAALGGDGARRLLLWQVRSGFGTAMQSGNAASVLHDTACPFCRSSAPYSAHAVCTLPTL